MTDFENASGTIRTAIVPGGDLEIAFGETRVVIYNVRNESGVAMSRGEWESLVESARKLRALAWPYNNKPGYWFP